MPSKWTPQFIAREIRSYVLIFLGVFGFKSTFFEPNHIPSGSMLPTMAIGDFILVNKFAYGFKFPFVEWFRDPWYLTSFSPPKRGDIVVFEYPINRNTLFVKRVIALPGDTIEVFNNKVFLNGRETIGQKIEGPEFERHRSLYDKKRYPIDLEFYRVQNGPHSHIVAHNKAQKRHLGTRKVQVPKDHFFVMGDNRDFFQRQSLLGPCPLHPPPGEGPLCLVQYGLPLGPNPFSFSPATDRDNLLVTSEIFCVVGKSPKMEAKTRLAQTLGPQGAREIYTGMLKDFFHHHKNMAPPTLFISMWPPPLRPHELIF